MNLGWQAAIRSDARAGPSGLRSEEAHEGVHVIWGWVIDEAMKDETRVTIIANGGFEPRPPARAGRGPGLSSGVSVLNPDDYDIPTFLKNVP